jgi:hypothetical protein
MKDRISRACAVLELLLIVFPMTVFGMLSWLFMGISMDQISTGYERLTFGAIAVLAPFLCIACGVVLMQAAFGDTHTYTRGTKFLWPFVVCGCAVAILGLTIQIAYDLRPDGNYAGLSSQFGVFAFGAPMLIPALHAEFLRSRSRGLTTRWSRP